MFINYFKSEYRSSPLNLAIARVILGIYFIWRGLSINTVAMIEWPVIISERTLYFYPPQNLEILLHIEKVLLIIFALSFIIGYRLRLSSFVMAFTMSHLAAIKMLYQHEIGETQQMMIASLLVILFALYAEQDHLSIDEFLRTKQSSHQDLNNVLKNNVQKKYKMSFLKMGLILIGILYFGAGWIKIINGPLFPWAEPESLARWTVIYSEYFQREFLLGQLLLESHVVLFLANWTTIFAEILFIFIILSGMSINIIIFLLYGFHISVIFAMGILFFDMIFMLAIFAAFDCGYSVLASNRKIDLIYNENSHFLVRILYMLKFLDINNSVDFYSQHNVPKEYCSLANSTEDICVIVNSSIYKGPFAFKELLEQFWFTIPIAWLIKFSFLRKIAKRFYRFMY